MRFSLLILLLVPLFAMAEEYFLDGAQRRELMMQGQITGRDGAQYDIWLVPGYSPPMRHVREGWRNAGEDLKDYSDAAYYDKAVDTTRDVMRFARREALREFALRGSSESWRKATALAQERTRRRVFGWWAAWPWAVIEASAESAFRVGVGVPGSAVIWGGGAVVTPAGFLVWPAAMATGHSLGQGVALPLAAVSWNTIIAPPLALAGQQPAPERADGFWMKRLADPAEADIRARLAAWQESWRAMPAVKDAQTALTVREETHKSRMAEIRAAGEAEKTSWDKDQQALRDTWRKVVREQALPSVPAVRRQLQEAGYGVQRLAAQRDVLLAELTSRGLDRASAEYLLSALLDAPPAAIDAPTRAPGEKTDPLREAIEGAVDAMSPPAPLPPPVAR